MQSDSYFRQSVTLARGETVPASTWVVQSNHLIPFFLNYTSFMEAVRIQTAHRNQIQDRTVIPNTYCKWKHAASFETREVCGVAGDCANHQQAPIHCKAETKWLIVTLTLKHTVPRVGCTWCFSAQYKWSVTIMNYFSVLLLTVGQMLTTQMLPQTNAHCTNVPQTNAH